MGLMINDGRPVDSIGLNPQGGDEKDWMQVVKNVKSTIMGSE
jgi:hypothetical protein